MIKRDFFHQILKFAGMAVILAAVVFAFGIFASPSLAGDPMSSMAKFDKEGNLVRPEGFREWIYVGTPLTPNDMNKGKAPFPEFHSVYIDPASWKHYKKTGKFRDGTILVKELISQERSDGKTVFLTTHDMTVADELCDRVAFMVEGRIVLITAAAAVRAAHDVEIAVAVDVGERKPDQPVGVQRADAV